MQLDVFRERFFKGAPRYQWIGLLGRGGVGIVFKAQDLELEEAVAIKVLSPDFDSEEQELLARFKREISLNRKIKHPNVARIHDFGISGEYPYITMEYCPGQDLRRRIHARRKLPITEAISILRQIAHGSHAAHQMGIIHRDLKSSNVMVGDDDAVAILDFGLARGLYDPGITARSLILGTPNYMSPEQAMGTDLDPRSDIYSIGIIAFEALTGMVPYDSDSPIATAMLHLTAPIPEERLVAAGIPAALRQIVVRALAKERTARFDTAAELESELARVQGELAVGGFGGGAPPAGDAVGAAVPATKEPVRPAAGSAPVAPATAEEPAAAAADEAPKTQVRRRHPVVLVVEDDPAERAAFARALLGSGCYVLEATNGQQALETLVANPVDLVVLDVTLPGMDGFDVTRVIKSQPTMSGLPIVLSSSQMSRRQFAFGIQAGANDFLTKPIAAGTLVWRIWKLLRPLGFLPPEEREAEKEAGRKRFG